MTLHFLNDVVNDIESHKKIYKYVIIASLNSESACELINKIPGWRILTSCLYGFDLFACPYTDFAYWFRYKMEQSIFNKYIDREHIVSGLLYPIRVV